MPELRKVETADLEARLVKVRRQREGFAYLAANITTLNLTAEYVLAGLRRDARDEQRLLEAELAVRYGKMPSPETPSDLAVSHA
jgi:hypothetical protein